MKKLSLALILAGVLLTPLFAAQFDNQREAAGLLALREPTKVVDFKLKDIHGKTVSLSSLEGHVVLLNFWATWCGPCRSEIPSLQSLYEKLRKKGLVVLAVNLRESRDQVKAFVKQYKMTFPVLLDADGRIGGTYGAQSIPTTYVIDKKGYALSGMVGAIHWDTAEIATYLTSLLEE